MPFRLSKKVLLNEGDQIRVSGGPYYLTQSGQKIGMGDKGVGTFVRATENGEGLYVQFAVRGTRLVYIGPEKVSELTGTIMRPHKIVKLRQK